MISSARLPPTTFGSGKRSINFEIKSNISGAFKRQPLNLLLIDPPSLREVNLIYTNEKAERSSTNKLKMPAIVSPS